MNPTETIIGLGTAAIGRPLYINIRPEQSKSIPLDAFRTQALQVLEEAYGLGVRYFDTAPNYGFAEQLLIDWIHESAKADLELASKWGYTYVANFDPTATQHELKEHSTLYLTTLTIPN